MRVSRNKKTARSKHYGFLEFASADVAAIAAEAMDGYMLFTQKLVCHIMPASEVHPELFKGANRRFKAIPWRKLEAEAHNKERTAAQQVLHFTFFLGVHWLANAPVDIRLFHIPVSTNLWFLLYV